MSIIKPISDLRNKSNEISELARETNEPIFITKNGEGDMVVLAIKQYRELTAKLNLFEKLAEAQAEELNGSKPKSLNDVIKNVRRKIDEKKN
jgi:prevent-host-death family protein